MDKSIRQQARTVIRGLRPIIACLAFLSLSTRAFAHTEPSPAQLDQTETGRHASTIEFQQRHAFNIPSESLNVALADFSAQSRMRVVAPGVLSGVLSRGVAGELSAVNALTALLHGTGMSFRQLDADTLVVMSEQMVELHSTQFQLAGNAFADQPPSAAAAPAASVPAPEAALQEVTVSASAISIAGYQAPTPVTAIGLQQLQSAAQPDIGNVLRQMPMIQGQNQNASSDDFSDNLGGIDLLDLRSLGVNRTLVLFDGQRVVAESNQGGVDTSLIPSTLVERTDVVTGGASATYGSDAIAGVINIIINKNFNGVMANVMWGNNTRNQNLQERADLTLGTPFAGGKGHVEVAGSFWNAPTWASRMTEPGWQSNGLVANPACTGYKSGLITAKCPPGQYIWLEALNVTPARGTQGGIITSGLNNQNIPLDNIAFGPGAVPYTFVCGNNTYNVTCNGGSYDASIPYSLGAPLKNYTGFALISYNINESLQVSLQLNYARTSVLSELNDTRQLGNISIYSGNPFIPASIQAQLTALNLPGFKMGNLLDDPKAQSLGGDLATLGDDMGWNYRTNQRGVFSLDGSLGRKWTWNAYYMHGLNDLTETAWAMAHIPNLNAAEDAVLVTPAINAAVPSLAVGSVTCAANVPLNLLPGGATGLVALASRPAGMTPGCQPVNLMGIGMVSKAAHDYILGPSQQPGNFPGYGGDTDHNVIAETVAAASIQGQLPFGLAAPVAVAAGILYRSEQISGVNCGINCTNVYFHGGNYVNDFGYYNIKEINAEVNVPVLKDKWVDDLSFDAAGRLSDYSTSGSVETYKFGVVSQLTNWLRFRGSYSVDIRAPNLYELFSLPQSEGGSLIDPRTGQTNNGFTLNVGNPKLVPEDAETRTFGFVFTPVRGMNVSIDWYYIAISNVIDEGYSSSQVLAQCLGGSAEFCNLLYFGHYPTNYCIGPTINSCPLSMPLNDIVNTKLNANSLTSSGMDFNGDYRVPFMEGTIDFNAALNYTFATRLTVLGSTNDNLNSLGGAESFYDTSIGPKSAPTTKFHGTVGATYTQGGWLGTVQARMIGAAWMETQWINTNFLSNYDNAVPFFVYFDLRGSYQWANGFQIYAAIDDVLDKLPPNAYAIAPTPAGGEVLRQDIYTQYGREYRLGLRYRFGG